MKSVVFIVYHIIAHVSVDLVYTYVLECVGFQLDIFVFCVGRPMILLYQHGAAPYFIS